MNKLILSLAMLSLSIVSWAQEQKNNVSDSLTIGKQIIESEAERPRTNHKVRINLAEEETVIPFKVDEDVIDAEFANTISGIRGDNYNIESLSHAFKQFYIYKQHSKTTYLGLAEYYELKLGIQWIPNDKLKFFSNYSFIREFAFTGNRIDMWDVNVGVVYNITPRLSFEAGASYVKPFDNSLENPNSGNPLLPQTQMGASFNYMVTKNTKIGIEGKAMGDSNLQNIGNVVGGKVHIGF